MESLPERTLLSATYYVPGSYSLGTSVTAIYQVTLALSTGVRDTVGVFFNNDFNIDPSSPDATFDLDSTRNINVHGNYSGGSSSAPDPTKGLILVDKLSAYDKSGVGRKRGHYSFIEELREVIYRAAIWHERYGRLKLV